jgi:hypothetical protein
VRVLPVTPHQTAVNAAAIRNLAARLDRLGFVGDSHAEAETIALNLLADGYRRIKAPVPTRGPGASRQAIEDAKAAAAAAVADARARRTTVNPEGDASAC